MISVFPLRATYCLLISPLPDARDWLSPAFVLPVYMTKSALIGFRPCHVFPRLDFIICRMHYYISSLSLRPAWLLVQFSFSVGCWRNYFNFFQFHWHNYQTVVFENSENVTLDIWDECAFNPCRNLEKVTQLCSCCVCMNGRMDNGLSGLYYTHSYPPIRRWCFIIIIQITIEMFFVFVFLLAWWRVRLPGLPLFELESKCCLTATFCLPVWI